MESVQQAHARPMLKCDNLQRTHLTVGFVEAAPVKLLLSASFAIDPAPAADDIYEAWQEEGGGGALVQGPPAQGLGQLYLKPGHAGAAAQ